VRIAAIFCIVVLTRLLFRSADLDMARTYLAGLFATGGGAFPVSAAGLAAFGAAAALHFSPVAWRDRFMDYAGTRPVWMFGVGFAAMVYVIAAMSRGRGGFIYFQF
jgi:hypothetical protein